MRPGAGGDEMILVMFFAVLALTVLCMVGPSRLVRWMRESMQQASAEAMSWPASSAPNLSCPEPAGPVSEEELMEQVLTAERLAGILSLEDYQRGMALIAANDAVSHPMAVPPERI
jgi:hypothetical protein